MRKSLQYVTATGLYDVIRGEVSLRNSFVGFSLFFFFFAQRTEFPSLPLSIRQILVKAGNESKMAEVPVDYPIPIGRFFTKTWRKRDVERRCGESRWINLCLVTICRFHEVVHSPSIFCQNRLFMFASGPPLERD